MENNIRSFEKKILPETENPMRFEINNFYRVDQIISILLRVPLWWTRRCGLIPRPLGRKRGPELALGFNNHLLRFCFHFFKRENIEELTSIFST
jgi:hypothetical protein